MSYPIIKLKNLTKYYDKYQRLIFYNTSLEINNEVHAIIGSNGIGKTSLIRMLAGFESPSKGEILIINSSGDYSTINNPSQMIDFKMAYAGQDDNFLETLTVKQNIILGLESKKAYFFSNAKETEFRIKELMEKFKIKLNLDKFVRDLAIEELKKLSLLRALFKEPRILLLDEPTVGLSYSQKAEFWLIFKKLREKEITVVFTTRDEEFAQAVAHRVSWIKKTKIMGTKAIKLKENIKLFIQDEWSKKIKYQKPTIKNQVALIYVDNFTLNDDKLPSFFNLEFAIRPGEIYGIYDYENLYSEVLIDSLVGLVKASSKKIWFEEKEVTFYEAKEFSKLNINWVPGQYAKKAVLYNDNLLNNFTLWNYNKREYVTKSGRVKRFEVKNKVAILSKAYNISDSRDGSVTVNKLSKAELQKFVLARSIEENPKLLILSNPFSDLDYNSAKIIIKRLAALTKKGNSVLIIDTDPFLLQLLCQRVAVLYHKEFVAKMVDEQVKAKTMINPELWPLANEIIIRSEQMSKLPQTKWFIKKQTIKWFFKKVFKPFSATKEWIKDQIAEINSRLG
ncbi:MAG: ATP-binding cassette domain-containing protein [Spiroplasma sp.]